MQIELRRFHSNYATQPTFKYVEIMFCLHVFSLISIYVNIRIYGNSLVFVEKTYVLFEGLLWKKKHASSTASTPGYAMAAPVYAQQPVQMTQVDFRFRKTKTILIKIEVETHLLSFVNISVTISILFIYIYISLYLSMNFISTS